MKRIDPSSKTKLAPPENGDQKWNDRMSLQAGALAAQAFIQIV
jgi:hypothetical protein